MATKAVRTSNVVELKQLRLDRFEIVLFGVSPLIMHTWSHKAKEQMLSKQMKKATAGKEAKDPQRDFEESMYLLNGLPAFPTVAFKQSAVDAAMAMDFKKTNLRQSFHIDGEMVPIVGSDPVPREDMVRVGMGTADIRYRAEFKQWAAILPITLNVGMLSVEQLVNLFDAAGFGIGVGEWRPQRNGQFGRFKVADDAERQIASEWAAKANVRMAAA